MSLIEKHKDDWITILHEYQQLRKPDADAIAELALNNFIEMRDKVATPNFYCRKKLKQDFMKNIPINGYRLIPR